MPIIRAVRDFLPAADNITKDPSGTDPYKVLPDTLYVWPRRMGGRQQFDNDAYGQGREDELQLRLRILYAIGNKGEARVDSASEEVSDLLDAAQEALIEAIADHRQGQALWIDLIVENTLPDVVKNDRARGVGIDLIVRVAAADEQEDDEDGS